MSRVKSGVVTHARHRKVVKAAKGHYGARSRNFRTAKQSVDKALQYATRDRMVKKRNFRALWIQRINAAEIDRKVLADLAVNDPKVFGDIVRQAKTSLV